MGSLAKHGGRSTSSGRFGITPSEITINLTIATDHQIMTNIISSLNG